MRQTIHLIIYTIVSAILMIGCTNNGSLPSGEGGGRGHVPQASDTLYTEKAAMDVYGTQPERALVIIDSAEIVGQLVSVDDVTDDYAGKTFEPTYGMADGSNEMTRIVNTNDMKTAAQRFANLVGAKGFEVIGVSFDQKKDAWVKAIGQLQMPWLQISDLQGWKCAAAPIYKIDAIPDNILIDPQGKIIDRALRGKALQSRLQKIFE